MGLQFLTIESFNKLLQQWSGDRIKISKHEQYDLDEILMTLQAISYERNTRRLDDYVPMHTLQLNGNGTMETDAREPQELPSSLYDIPLDDHSLYEFDGNQFLISTSRGVYKIERV
ncbi:hypothetical protein GCM10008983_12570 [Lentibacillus halophilus]|uniref:Uncharacterized protein n=1 Tax=Lentibacillus halophilus TaxID=295065 RepID=A0ABN0Z7C3_9BACI